MNPQLVITPGLHRRNLHLCLPNELFAEYFQELFLLFRVLFLEYPQLLLMLLAVEESLIFMVLGLFTDLGVEINDLLLLVLAVLFQLIDLV